MKLSINLATRPFVELRPFFLRLRLLMAMLALVAVGLAVAAHMMSVKLNKAQAQMNELRDRTLAAQKEKIQAEASMHRPENAAVLDRAHFLNRLFLAKSFSWTAVMMDLENVLPAGVQVTSIEPQVTAEGDVIIRLKVGGERDRAIELVRKLEHSHRFLEPRLMGESTKSNENAAGQRAPVNPNLPSATEFDILARYNPLPESEPYRYTQGTHAGMTPAVPFGNAKATSTSRYPKNGVVLAPAPVKGGLTR